METWSGPYFAEVITPARSSGGERYRHLGNPKFFRGDAAFARPAFYRLLEQEDYQHAIRIPANEVLEQEIAHLLKCSVGRPPQKPIVLYGGFLYRAASWDEHRRVVAKVEWHRDELYPRVGFIVTNLCKAPEQVVHFYNDRGTVEQCIKEGKSTVKETRLSCRTFKDNQTRLQLFALTYNLANFFRRLALPLAVRHWSLTTLREKLVKTGDKVVGHSKCVFFQVAVMRRLFPGQPAPATAVAGKSGLSRDVGHDLDRSRINCGWGERCGATQRRKTVPPGDQNWVLTTNSG